LLRRKSAVTRILGEGRPWTAQSDYPRPKVIKLLISIIYKFS
jgi:hypothetical protein